MFNSITITKKKPKKPLHVEREKSNTTNRWVPAFLDKDILANSFLKSINEYSKDIGNVYITMHTLTFKTTGPPLAISTHSNQTMVSNFHPAIGRGGGKRQAL